MHDSLEVGLTWSGRRFVSGDEDWGFGVERGRRHLAHRCGVGMREDAGDVGRTRSASLPRGVGGQRGGSGFMERARWLTRAGTQRLV